MVIIIRFIRWLPHVLVLTLIWVILNERFGWEQVLTGLVLSLLVIAFTNTQLLLGDYSSSYMMRPLTFIRYFTFLVWQIYKSGMLAIIRIIKGADAVQISPYFSSLPDDFSLTLLANAITLTPGTVTVCLEEHVLQVLRFAPLPSRKKRAPADENDSISKIERILACQRK